MLMSSTVKASVAWRLWNHYETLVPATETVLRLNLDKTSVCLFQGDVAGNVLVSKKRARSVAQRVPRAKRRCCMTHVGLICDRSDIQPLLPQVFIINERTAPARDMAALRAACPPNVRFVKQKSAWTNVFVTAYIVRLLGIALGPYHRAADSSDGRSASPLAPLCAGYVSGCAHLAAVRTCVADVADAAASHARVLEVQGVLEASLPGCAWRR